MKKKTKQQRVMLIVRLPSKQVRRSGRNTTLAVTLAIALAGCAPVGPDFVKPQASLPDEWSQQAEQGINSDAGSLVEWWQVFNDPVLNELMLQALKQNNNLEIAGLRVLESLAQLGIATGARFPQSQAAFGEATYVSPAENSGSTSNFWTYGLGASASWEIDFVKDWVARHHLPLVQIVIADSGKGITRTLEKEYRKVADSHGVLEGVPRTSVPGRSASEDFTGIITNTIRNSVERHSFHIFFAHALAFFLSIDILM